MSQLFVYHTSMPSQAVKVLNHAEDISSTLARVGVHCEHWQTDVVLTAQSSSAEIQAAYADAIAQLKERTPYAMVDLVSMDEKHPEKEALRAQFLDEHTHTEDEVRFFVSGRGLFSVHIDEHIYAVLCEKGALISIPAGTAHWFDMGEHPRFTALRFFNSPDGLVEQRCEASIAQAYPKLDDLI